MGIGGRSEDPIAHALYTRKIDSDFPVWIAVGKSVEDLSGIAMSALVI